MEKKETIKVGVFAFLLILAIIAIAVMVCYIYVYKHNTNEEIARLEENSNNLQNKVEELQGTISKIGNIITPDEKKTTETNNTNNSNSGNNTSNSANVESIAKKLFEEGSEKIRETFYSDFYQYDKTRPIVEFVDKSNGITYYKTDKLYSDVKKEYAKIFTGEALGKILAKRFANIDGYLYVSAGGATGWDITNIKLSKVSEENNEIKYIVKYCDVLIEDSVSEEKSCNMTIKLENRKL